MTTPTAPSIDFFDYSLIPDDTLESLTHYVNTGRDPGGFLTAVLANDLGKAVDRADNRNRYALVTLVIYLFNKVPVGAVGSYERVSDWKASGGLKGK